jgi:F-type H+-transporting ATPase subunit delta
LIKNIIAKRYSQALIQSFAENEYRSLDNVLEELSLFFEKNEDIKEFFVSPVIEKSSKLDILDEFSTQLEFDQRLHNFIKLLIIKDRIFYLPEIFTAAIQVLHDKLKIFDFHLVTAHDIKPEIKDTIMEYLNKHIKGEIKFKHRIDRSLQGGFLVYNDNLAFDASIKNNFHVFLKSL